MDFLNRLTLGLLALSACGPNRTYPDRAHYVPSAVEPLSCVPNLDGKLEAAEAPTVFDVPVRYLVNPAGTSRAVDVVGSHDSGRTTWALSTDFADDQVATLSARPLAGAWFASSFPSGQFISPLDLGGLMEAVFVNVPDELRMLGYASRDMNGPSGRTLVVYSQPVVVARYPLEVGKTWVSVADVRNSVVQGLPYAGRDTYQMRVDAAGQLELPDVSFTQALRMRTTLTIEPSVGASITRRQVGWFFECFGEVARATSANNEPNEDFSQTPELRRLGF